MTRGLDGPTSDEVKLPRETFEQFRHDARQSVATLLCLVEVAMADTADARSVSERLTQIAGQVRSTAELLDDLGPGEPSAPSDAGAECADVVRAVAAGFGGTVRMMSDSGTQVVMPRVALRRVVTNLMTNALRAAGRSGVVEASVRRRGHCVILEVEDDGPGFGALPAQHGIGLGSVQGLVTSAHGFLDIGRGRLGGARLRVTLPSAGLMEVSGA